MLTDSQRVRWGIIGCGNVVKRKSGPALQQAEHSEVTAVMRRSDELVRRYARKHNVPFWTTDAAEVIQHPDVDAVYIATPPEHHLHYALQVCAAGKPCLVEKPPGRSAAEFARMVTAFENNNTPLFVAYYRRHLEKFLKVKEILASGRLGPVVSIDYRYSSPSREGNWRLSPQRSGGGLFYDLGCHVLDLLDDWFGPVEFIGGTAVNALPTHQAEDAVALCFRTADGAVGSALWNFAAHHASEAMVIEGLRGRLTFSCIDCWSPVVVELASGHTTKKPKKGFKRRWQRLLRRLRGKPLVDQKGRSDEHSFAKLPYPHQPLMQAVTDAILTGAKVEPGGATALRTSRLLDAALDHYYAGRDKAFWEQPERWRSLQATMHKDPSPASPDYTLTEAQLRQFEEQGYLGPFRCETGNWGRLAAMTNLNLNPHLENVYAHEICTHPSVVDRVTQLLGNAGDGDDDSSGISLFKSRFWFKAPHSNDPTPWHQDVGRRNGGVMKNGKPVPTVTAWLSLNGASTENGALKVLPGSHRQLVGEWKKSIRANLEEAGDLDRFDLSAAVDLVAKPGEFYLFDSWLLHGSGINATDAPRTALNMRYIETRHAAATGFPCIEFPARQTPDVDTPSLPVAKAS